MAEVEAREEMALTPTHSTKVECVADTFIDGRDAPGRNFGDKAIMGATETKDAALLKFDLKGYPEIARAVLCCYCTGIWREEARPIAVWGVDHGWEEDQVTWNTKPREIGRVADGVSMSIPSWWRWEDDRLTEHVERCRREGVPVSLALDVENGLYESISDMHYGIAFLTKEFTPKHVPYLEVETVEKPPKPLIPREWIPYIVVGGIAAVGLAVAVYAVTRE